MSGNFERRLSRLRVVCPPPPPPPEPVDAWPFTDDEWATIRAIEGRYASLPRRPDGSIDVAVFSDDDIETLAEIGEAVKARRAAS